MMKNILNKIMMLSMCFACLGVSTSCNHDGPTEPFMVRVASAGTNSLTLEVVTDGISVSQVAYIVSESADVQMQPLLVFADADSVVNVADNKRFTVDSVSVYVMGNEEMQPLDADKDYYIYCAARTGAGFYNSTYVLKATTQDYSHFTKMLSVVETYHDGYNLRITAPQSVKNNPEKYAVRYTFTCLPMYLLNKIKGIPDYELLTTNAGMHTTRSKTINFNNKNEVLYDENGEPIIDEDTGETIWLHDPIVPGEPTVFLGAQFQWVEKDDPLCPYGWNSGYHLHTFDIDKWATENATVAPSRTEGLEWVNYEDSFWKGDFERLFFVVEQPQEIAKSAEELFEIDEVEITPVKAVIDIVPSDDVKFYCYTLIDKATYNAVLPWLDDNEDYMQWFITSWLAVYELSTKTAYGPVRVTTDDLYYDGLESDTEYHLLMVAMGDEEGKTQKYYDYKITTPSKKLSAPEVIVTAKPLDQSKLYMDAEYHNQHAFYAHYNVKAPNGDLKEAWYNANYVKDWVSKLNSEKYTYEDLLAEGGISFTATELALINSAEGLDIMIPTVDGETTRFVVRGRNEENTPNNLKVKNPSESTAIADYAAPFAMLEPRVTSPLFTELTGEWTATAKICYSEYVYNENNEQVLTRNLHDWSTNVLITSEFVEGVDYPADLPESVYAIYEESMGEKYSKTSVDQWYDDFKNQAKLFNKNRLVGQNRLMVHGIISCDSYDRLNRVTPYELFYHSEYSSYNPAQIFYDFGPKWFLDIDNNGNVTVPFSYSSMAPVTNWQDVPYFLAGMWYDKDDSSNSTSAFVEGSVGFPVEISADMNTITIKPIENTSDPSKPLYMNVVSISGSEPSIYAPIVSELVLTRGWTEHETTKEDISAKNSVTVKPVDAQGRQVAAKRPVSVKSMTKLELRKELPVQDVEVLRLENLEEKLDKYARKMTDRKYAMPCEY